MVFTAPAVHYSALATQPPDLKLSKSQQSIRYATNVRFRLSRILQRWFYNDHSTRAALEEHIHLSESTSPVSQTEGKGNPNNNNSEHKTNTQQESTKSVRSCIEPDERVPFTEPYTSMLLKDDKSPRMELPIYHRQCNSSERDTEQMKYRNSVEPQHSSNRAITSATISSISSSIENCIGFQYASRKNSLANGPCTRSQQGTRLRRLHSKPKIRSNSNLNKNPPISSSIAHRIELLKQAMHNHELDFQQPKSEKSSPSEFSSSLSITNKMNKQTQTNSEVHHIHHHHIHSSSMFSIEWRTYLSLIATIILVILLFMQFVTINL
ncbi:unnamed protein product [Adineta ricciae]|uniref:Uncharacterized protein n=1 Tax=Adineta ricciae TaxID=249248 RepID=A0A813ZKT5_ADIRI|nr:unnamed protein product [Adineta ricciae]CAF1152805.1 unnamed protein product [Adineta ricciae]